MTTKLVRSSCNAAFKLQNSRQRAADSARSTEAELFERRRWVEVKVGSKYKHDEISKGLRTLAQQVWGPAELAQLPRPRFHCTPAPVQTRRPLSRASKHPAQGGNLSVNRKPGNLSLQLGLSLAGRGYREGNLGGWRSAQAARGKTGRQLACWGDDTWRELSGQGASPIES